VLCLGVVVDAVTLHGLDSAMRDVLPTGATLPALLGIAAVAAVLSNIVNNLPAVLVMLPLVAASGPAAVLAVLVGVNVGPNLTYVGSLPTCCGAMSFAAICGSVSPNSRASDCAPCR
jgi:arsenical pump membrane protein